VEELENGAITNAEIQDWARYRSTTERRLQRHDYYGCMVLAKLSGMCGGSSDPNSYFPGKRAVSYRTISVEKAAALGRSRYRKNNGNPRIIKSVSDG